MRKSVKIITGFLLTAILSAAAVFASFSDRLDVVNHISVGDVSISISEYARKGKGVACTTFRQNSTSLSDNCKKFLGFHPTVKTVDFPARLL